MSSAADMRPTMSATSMAPSGWPRATWHQRGIRFVRFPFFPLPAARSSFPSHQHGRGRAAAAPSCGRVVLLDGDWMT